MAVGCIGMSHDDFCKCTFTEFESICKTWREMTEGQSRDAWERARTIAAIIIQPHLKKGTKITAKQLWQLPWDKKQHRGEKVPKLTAEEKRKRFEEVAHRLGDEINK